MTDEKSLRRILKALHKASETMDNDRLQGFNQTVIEDTQPQLLSLITALELHLSAIS